MPHSVKLLHGKDSTQQDSISTDDLAHRQALSRFQPEAKAASSLNQANICMIHEIDESDGRTFIAMELLEGQERAEIAIIM